MRLIAPLLLLCAALAGCSDDLSDSLGPEGSFLTIHAVPDLLGLGTAPDQLVANHPKNITLLAAAMVLREFGYKDLVEA